MWGGDGCRGVQRTDTQRQEVQEQMRRIEDKKATITMLRGEGLPIGEVEMELGQAEQLLHAMLLG